MDSGRNTAPQACCSPAARPGSSEGPGHSDLEQSLAHGSNHQKLYNKLRQVVQWFEEQISAHERNPSSDGFVFSLT